jgi:hypothetical protein
MVAFAHCLAHGGLPQLKRLELDRITMVDNSMDDTLQSLALAVEVLER